MIARKTRQKNELTSEIFGVQGLFQQQRTRVAARLAAGSAGVGGALAGLPGGSSLTLIGPPKMDSPRYFWAQTTDWF